MARCKHKDAQLESSRPTYADHFPDVWIRVECPDCQQGWMGPASRPNAPKWAVQTWLAHKKKEIVDWLRDNPNPPGVEE